MIAIAVAATKSYLHVWDQCIQHIATAAAHVEEAHFIFASDQSKEAEKAFEAARQWLPEGWRMTILKLPFKDDSSQNYKVEAQLRIAKLQGAAFAFARKIRASQLWSVESDVLVPSDALRVLSWSLEMPSADGSPFYDIGAATYPNGLFLGGFGTHQNQIAEDFLPEERIVPTRLKTCVAACESRLKAQSPSSKEKETKRLERLQKRVKACPPDGNIWEVTAKHGWRRRGWLDFAYPGIGKGAMVPSDWCGLGCTLLSSRALAYSDFSGYVGQGTQDLFLCWQRWHPAGLRITCVPHVVCDHVKRRGDTIEHLVAYHEPTGEFRGHLRVRPQPWVAV